MNTQKNLLIASSLLLATPVMAHTGYGVHGFESGLSHPLLGADHLMAMLTVGIWSALALNTKRWLGPATFIGGMSLGAILGLNGVALPLLEPSIALSVVMMGLLLLAFTRIPTQASLGLIGLFALFHGNAHGLEAPLGGTVAAYMAGFLFSTTLLHVAGLGFGSLLRTQVQRWLVPAIGGGISLFGMWLLLAQ
jgi:urease accessory protein